MAAAMLGGGRAKSQSIIAFLPVFRAIRSAAVRGFSTTNAPSSSSEETAISPPAKDGPNVRGKKISQAMRSYLARTKAHTDFMNEEVAEYEIGKRHLAVIMGEDPDTFSQEDIDRAIRYLLPSGMYDKKARPKLKPPAEMIPPRKAAQFGADGRPFHTMFYSGKPNFHQLMHDYGVKLEKLQQYEDSQSALGLRPSADAKIQLAGSVWVKKSHVESLMNEKISEAEYVRLQKLVERIAEQPYSMKEQESVMQLRESLLRMSMLDEVKEIQYDEDGRGYVDAEGKRRNSTSSIRMLNKGSGKIIVNNGNYLDHFPSITDRLQVMAPLQLCGMLNSVDVDATVKDGGPSTQSGALRLAISRALQSFVSEELTEKLRLAGYLTVDPRVKERKKPGQKRARKKFTWKKR